MTVQAVPVAVQPLVGWPHTAEQGRTYLLTVDLRLAAGATWPYEEEEYPVYCIVATGPTCSLRPLGPSAVILHRYGGTYGPARFLLTALEPTNDSKLHLTLANRWGLPILGVPLPMRIVSALDSERPETIGLLDRSLQSTIPDAERRQVVEREAAEQPISEAGEVRWDQVAPRVERASVLVANAAGMNASGYFVAPDLIATASHLGRGTEAPDYRVRWEGRWLPATLLYLEGAVMMLRLRQMQGNAEVLTPGSTATEIREGDTWVTFGFARATEEGERLAGTVLGGRFTSALTTVPSGLVGAPVIVAGELVGQVSGVTRDATLPAMTVIEIVPAEEIRHAIDAVMLGSTDQTTEPYVPPSREQLDEFQRLLDDPGNGWALHYIGRGGMGKTTLLRHISTDVARRLGIPTSRVDFDFLSPDYPVRHPGELVLELADGLRPYATTEREERLLRELQARVAQLHDSADQYPGDPLASLQGLEFDRTLRTFCDLLRLLPQPVVLILDSCQELANLSSIGTPTLAVEATFSILERVHLELPGLRVVFAGRRLLARSGYGWQASAQEETAQLPELKAYLRLHEIQGFTETQAIIFLTQVRHLSLSDELLRAVLARSRAAIGPAAITWVASRPSAPEARYSPSDLALHADWIRENPTLTPAMLASAGGGDPYIETRIIGRIQDSEVQALLPAVALLGRFDKAMLRPAFTGSDEAFDEAYLALTGAEWIEQQSDALQNPFLEVDRYVRPRLLAYYQEADRQQALNEAAQRLRQGISALVRQRALDSLGVDHVETALRLLPPDQAAALWDRLELNIAEGARWLWADAAIRRLLGEDGAIAAATHPLRAAVQATYCAVQIHLQRNADLAPQWRQVAELAAAHPDPRTSQWLRQRAVAGQVGAIGGSGQSPSDALLGAFWDLLAAVSDDPAGLAGVSESPRVEQLAASICAALEALLERTERMHDAELLPRHIGDQVDRWASAVASAGVSPRITAFAHMLAGRVAVLHRQWQKATASLRAAASALPSATDHPEPQTWLDWRAPTSLRQRIRLETMRASSLAMDVSGPPVDSVIATKIFVSFSPRAHGEVVNVLGDVLDEFSSRLRVVQWNQIENAGPITAQLTEAITTSRFGLFYLSEPHEDARGYGYRDDLNVLFEAGMLHAMTVLAGNEPSGWIPLREPSSPSPPFDLANPLIELVPRTTDGRLEEERLRARLRARIARLLGD